MPTQYYALKLDDVVTLTNILEPDIIESPVLDNLAVFNDLHINVIEDTEFERTKFIFRRKGGEARRYEPGKTLKSNLGFMEESKLRVVQAWARYEQNLQSFREKEPFSILGSNKTYNAPVSEFIIRNIGKQYAGDVLSNLFFGKEALGVENSMGLYDGYWTKIDQFINAGAISKDKLNLVDCDPIDDDVETYDGENYDIFLAWVEGWHPLLRTAQDVVVYMSPTMKRRIIHSYMRKFVGLQSPSAGTDSFRLLDMPNIELKASALIGEGDRMIATVKGNLEFGLDQNDDWSSVAVHMDQNDFNVLIFQIQSTQGVRILDISGTKFCVSNGTIKPIDQLNGDYQTNTLTVTSNDATMGRVTVDPQKTEYEAGETVTLTPTAESGYEFVKWDDGATTNPRSIVYPGYPISLQAVFKATESRSETIKVE